MRELVELQVDPPLVARLEMFEKLGELATTVTWLSESRWLC